MTSNATVVKWSMENPPIFESFWFEKADYVGWQQFMRDNQHLPFLATGIYLVVIFGLQSVMKSRKPLNLRKLLMVWNWALGIFSICGFLRMLPELLYVLSLSNGFHRSVCIREGFNQPTAFWALLFAFSKFVELGDTVFIVLRKQPLILLQWYHHGVTLIFVWIVLPYSEPIQRYYGVMNFFVHSIMYPYFALRTMKVFIPRKFAMTLTFLQFIQMIVAVAVNIYSVYTIAMGQSCARDPMTIKLSLIIYASFGILFGQFLLTRYFHKVPKKFD